MTDKNSNEENLVELKELDYSRKFGYLTAEIDEKFDTDINDTAVEPPDGGWGWMIVLAAFLNSVIVDGVSFCFGIFLTEYSEYFDSSIGATSLASALLIGICHITGPIVGALINKFGGQLVCFSGAIIGATAFIISSFTTSLFVFQLTYGLLGGFSFGMIYLPANIMAGLYFKKKRSIATGIAVCGTGIGTFSLAPIARLLLQYMDWKQAHFILAGIVLQGCVTSCLLRPLSVQPDQRSLSKSESQSEVSTKFTDDGLMDQHEKKTQPMDKIESFSSWCGARKLLPKPVADFLSGIIDTDILKNRGMLIFYLANIIGVPGYYVPILFSSDRAINYGISKTDAALLITILGICNTVGRILFGFVAYVPRLSPIIINGIGTTMAGVCVMLIPLCTDWMSMAIMTAGYGFFLAPFISLAAVIICELAGPEKLTNGFGLLFLVRGVTATIGPPLEGKLYDITGNYNASFFTGGACLIVCGILNFILVTPCVNKKYKSHDI